jgi:hypothetical protein
MYDFFFGTREDIESDPQTWLLTIKRMLPRWPNGIPDSEFIALFDLLDDFDFAAAVRDGKRPVLLETGSGASTIVLLYFACRWDTRLYTWDIASTKLAYLRGVLNDTLFRHFREKNMFNHWQYIAYTSTDPHVGIPVLGEIDANVCAAFYDSEHTWRNLEQELSATVPYLCDGALLAIDDANYTHKDTNTAYVNMIRTKLGLAPVNLPDNTCRPFREETENLLKNHFRQVENLAGGSYRQAYRQDIFWTYYSSDRNNMNRLGMEKLDSVAHRFEAWRLYR